MVGGAASRKGKAATAAVKSYYLCDAEKDYFERNFETEAGRGVAGASGGLSLDKWLPWQSSLQAHHSVGHSSASRNFVDIIQLIQVQRNDWGESQPPEALTGCRNPEADAFDEAFDDAFDDAFADAFAEVNEPVAERADETTVKPEEQQLDILLRPSGGLYSSDFMELFQRSASAAEGDAFDFPDPPTGAFVLSPAGSADESPEASSEASPVLAFSDWTRSSGRKPEAAGQMANENEKTQELIQVIDLTSNFR